MRKGEGWTGTGTRNGAIAFRGCESKSFRRARNGKRHEMERDGARRDGTRTNLVASERRTKEGRRFSRFTARRVASRCVPSRPEHQSLSTKYAMLSTRGLPRNCTAVVRRLRGPPRSLPNSLAIQPSHWLPRSRRLAPLADSNRIFCSSILRQCNVARFQIKSC